MKKRMIAAIMPFVLVFIMSAQTVQAAEPRAAGATLNLSFNGTTAVCSAICKGDQTSDEIEATICTNGGYNTAQCFDYTIIINGETVSGETIFYENTD